MAETMNKPEFIVTSSVKKLVKGLGNQSGPEFLTALDSVVSATVRKACSDLGPNKRLNETSISGPKKSSNIGNETATKFRELRDVAACALLQVNVVTRKDYIKFFQSVRELTDQLINL
jgi:hypothetical protein